MIRFDENIMWYYLAGKGLFEMFIFDLELMAATLLEGIACTLLLAGLADSFLRKIGKFLIWTFDNGQFRPFVNFLGILGIEGIAGMEGIEGMVPSLTYFSIYDFPRV